MVAGPIAVGAGVAGCRSLGRLLYHEDALERADAVFVLGGARLERAAEAAHLYLEGWAPRVVLSPQWIEAAEIALRQRGIRVPTESEVQVMALQQMGVPATAIEVLEPQIATATEADAIRDVVRRRGWQRIIIVTSKMHSMRASLVMRRRFAGAPVTLIVRASRYDSSDVDRWWETRPDLRFVLWEVQKLAAYWVGIAD